MARPVFFVDLMSQPCRAVEILCRVNGLDVERRRTQVGKKEHKSPEYLAVNPLGTLPFMQARSFCLKDWCPS